MGKQRWCVGGSHGPGLDVAPATSVHISLASTSSQFPIQLPGWLENCRLALTQEEKGSTEISEHSYFCCHTQFEILTCVFQAVS